METGSIEFRGHETGENDSPGRNIAYAPQREAVDWDFPITVRGLVEMGRFPALGLWREFGDTDHQIVDEALDVVDLRDYSHRQISALSAANSSSGRSLHAHGRRSRTSISSTSRTRGLIAMPARPLPRPSTSCATREAHHFIPSRTQRRAVIFDHVILINGELVASGSTEEIFTTREHREGLCHTGLQRSARHAHMKHLLRPFSMNSCSARSSSACWWASPWISRIACGDPAHGADGGCALTLTPAPAWPLRRSSSGSRLPACSSADSSRRASWRLAGKLSPAVPV